MSARQLELLQRAEALPIEALSDAMIVARFWSSVSIRGANDCWPYGTRGTYGHFSFRFNEETYSMVASRFSLALKLRAWPKRFACHACDNPPCVNPAHIWDGSARDNSRDMTSKARHWRQRESQILGRETTGLRTPTMTAAHKRFAEWLEWTNESQEAVARRLGCAQPTVSNIALGIRRAGSIELAMAIERATASWPHGPITTREWIVTVPDNNNSE